MAPVAPHRRAHGSDASRRALRDLASANGDYGACDRPQKALVDCAASLAKTAGAGSRDVAEAPLLGEDGGTTDAIDQALRKAKKVLKALEAM